MKVAGENLYHVGEELAPVAEEVVEEEEKEEEEGDAVSEWA